MDRISTRTIVFSGLVIAAITGAIWTFGSTHVGNLEENGLVASLQAAQAPPAQLNDDEQLDASLRKFGYAAGAAYQCAEADREADRERVVGDVKHAYSRIGQLFGTDHAFYFAAAFGGGTVQTFDKARCAELIKKLQDSVLVRRLRQ
jgi:hypothetical protein